MKDKQYKGIMQRLGWICYWLIMIWIFSGLLGCSVTNAQEDTTTVYIKDGKIDRIVTVTDYFWRGGLFHHSSLEGLTLFWGDKRLEVEQSDQRVDSDGLEALSEGVVDAVVDRLGAVK